jgi:hypothetical protein
VSDDDRPPEPELERDIPALRAMTDQELSGWRHAMIEHLRDKPGDLDGWNLLHFSTNLAAHRANNPKKVSK